MGQTIAEKILAVHADREVVRPGEFVVARVDLVLANDITGPPTISQFRRMGATGVFDPDRVALVPDHFTPPKDVYAAALISALRAFAREQGIAHYWEMGEVGIEHTLLPEEGLIRPRMIVVGGDSHTCTYGAFAAFGSGLGSTDVAAALALGETWFRVPGTIHFRLRGRPGAFVTGKDVILEVIRRIGVAGANFRVLEFGGEVGALNIDERMAVANMAVEAGAETGLFPADDVALTWLAAHPRTRTGTVGRTDEETEAVSPLASDPDAEFEADHELDLAALVPLVAIPFSPGNVQSAAAVRGVRVDQIYLGNCANGTLTDLRQAASLLTGRRLARGVRMIVVPATPRIYRHALREGLIETFLDAGCVVAPSTCGACAGLHMGVLDGGEVCVSTTNRNFRGRMGHPESQVYLANAYVAAASGVAGELVSPEAIAPPAPGRTA